MHFSNSTDLRTEPLLRLIARGTAGWPHDALKTSVRYSRGADFSGSFHPTPPRIHVNLGRRNRYPFTIKTYIAKARTDENCWWRELYSIQAADATQLVFFVFMHEFYHWLVRKARRNRRQKEARCDRFAVRAMVDLCGAVVLDPRGRPVPRAAWDFQDLDGFVSAARPAAAATGRAARKPVILPGKQSILLPAVSQEPSGQMKLFDA